MILCVSQSSLQQFHAILFFKLQWNICNLQKMQQGEMKNDKRAIGKMKGWTNKLYLSQLGYEVITKIQRFQSDIFVCFKCLSNCKSTFILCTRLKLANTVHWRSIFKAFQRGKFYTLISLNPKLSDVKASLTTFKLCARQMTPYESTLEKIKIFWIGFWDK